MKQIIKLSYLILLAISVIACYRENCTDINFGDKMLDPVSRTYESFDGVNTLVYKDIAGGKHRYDLYQDIDKLRSNFNQDSCDGAVINIRFTSEYYLRIFSAPNETRIAVAVLPGFLDGEQIFEEDRVVDILKLSVFDESATSSLLSRICVMTSSRQGELDQQAFNSNEYIVHDSLTLLNKTFYNVFEQRNGTVKLYYTPTDGVVSFTDNEGTELVLDRVE